MLLTVCVCEQCGHEILSPSQRHICQCGCIVDVVGTSVINANYLDVVGELEPIEYPPRKASKPSDWWVRILTRLQTPEDRGIGDTVQRIAAKFGGERFKRFAKRIGLPCGCTGRQARWNADYPNPNYRG